MGDNWEFIVVYVLMNLLANFLLSISVWKILNFSQQHKICQTCYSFINKTLSIQLSVLFIWKVKNVNFIWQYVMYHSFYRMIQYYTVTWRNWILTKTVFFVWVTVRVFLKNWGVLMKFDVLFIRMFINKQKNNLTL